MLPGTHPESHGKVLSQDLLICLVSAGGCGRKLPSAFLIHTGDLLFHSHLGTIADSSARQRLGVGLLRQNQHSAHADDPVAPSVVGGVPGPGVR